MPRPNPHAHHHPTGLSARRGVSSGAGGTLANTCSYRRAVGPEQTGFKEW